jgi:O-antigen/teichoic acid export membrane protein
MSKASDIAKVSATGSFHLLWGLVVSTIISSVGTIFIARLLGPDSYGLYAIVLTVPNLIVIFRDWGVNSAMVRFTAVYRGEGRIEEVRSIFLSGIIFEIALGLALSIFSFLFADFLATSVFNRPIIAPLIQIASFSVFASGLVAAATAAFTGYEKMELNSIMLIVQSIFRTVIIITLVIVGLGTSGAIIGYTAAMFIAGIIGLLLMWTIYRNMPKPKTNKLEIKAYLTAMLTYCLPLSLANIIMGLLPQYYAFLLPIHYATENTVIGNYGIATSFVVLIGFFATPITTMMFPAFSKLDAEKDREALRNIFQFSVKYAALLVVPVAALVMCLAEPAVATLFGNTYDSAPLFLALLASSYAYTALGNLSTGNLINSQGQTKLTLKLQLLTAAIGLPMGLILILQFGVIGLIITTLTAGLPRLFILLWWVKKQFSVTLDWRSSAKILLSAAIAAALTYTIITQLDLFSWIRLSLGVTIFILTLTPVILVTKTITKADISNLRLIVGELGILSKLINKVLNVFEKIIVFLK